MTIIEVVLVLAIAGLIFLMVFIALPALQRSQRDTERKNNYAATMAAMTDYASNNHGAAITQLSDLADYLSDDAADPGSGVPYNTIGDLGNQGALSEDTPIAIVYGEDCEGNAGLGARRYAFYGFLENGEYCKSN